MAKSLNNTHMLKFACGHTRPISSAIAERIANDIEMHMEYALIRPCDMCEKLEEIAHEQLVDAETERQLAEHDARMAKLAHYGTSLQQFADAIEDAYGSAVLEDMFVMAD